MLMTRDAKYHLVLVTKREGGSVTGKVLSPLVDGALDDCFLDMNPAQEFFYSDNRKGGRCIYATHSFVPEMEDSFYKIPSEMLDFLNRKDLKVRDRTSSRYSEPFFGFIKSCRVECDETAHAQLIKTNLCDIIYSV